MKPSGKNILVTGAGFTISRLVEKLVRRGHKVRPFISVVEVDAAVGEKVNSGSAFEGILGDTAQLIAEVMGVSIEVVTDEQRIRPERNEVERLFASNSKLRALTGWPPFYAGPDVFRCVLGKTVT